MRAWLNGERIPGRRRLSGVDRFAPYEPYVRQRLTEDPHLRGTALYDEVKGLGYPQSYPTLARKVRLGGLRPPCSACSGVRGRPTAQIEQLPASSLPAPRERLQRAGKYVVVQTDERNPRNQFPRRFAAMLD